MIALTLTADDLAAVTPPPSIVAWMDARFAAYLLEVIDRAPDGPQLRDMLGLGQ